jgi:hypothetical protein
MELLEISRNDAAVAADMEANGKMFSPESEKVFLGRRCAWGRQG